MDFLVRSDRAGSRTVSEKWLHDLSSYNTFYDLQNNVFRFAYENFTFIIFNRFLIIYLSRYLVSKHSSQSDAYLEKIVVVRYDYSP